MACQPLRILIFALGVMIFISITQLHTSTINTCIEKRRKFKTDKVC